MAIIRVGTNRDYTNINTAIGAASEGDVILIDPGDYGSQGTITVNKPVHLVGDTKDVMGNQIRLLRLYFSGGVPTKTTKVVVENLYIYRTDSHYAFYSSSSWPKEVEVVFNKCYARTPHHGYYISYWYSQAYITCINCTFLTQYLYTSYESSNIASKFSTIRHQVESSNGFVSAVYQDHVITTADSYGYGCNYGYSYFKLPSKYYFQGTVTEQLVPAARTIKAYRRDNDTIMAQTTSNAATGAYKMVTEYSGEHYLICRAGSVAEQYNDLVRALVLPAIEDYEENQWTHSDKYTLTIDHTLVDEDLFDFPLLIKLNTSCGLSNFNAEDIFVKLTSFASRWSLQTDDNQQLYIELIKWDHSNREAIAWAQVPLVKSNEDTVLTLHYDALLPNNAFNVGAASNRLTSHLWGRSCIGTWHMEEDPGDGGDVRDSTYWGHHSTPYDLGSTAHIDTTLGKAIDFNSGYLKVTGLNNNLTNDMTLFAVVKFEDMNSYGTIFCEGDHDNGWEVGIDNGKLFSCINNADDYHKEVYATISGISDEYHLITSTVDVTNNTMKLYLDGTEVANKLATSAMSSYIGTNGETIGTSYTSSPYWDDSIIGVNYNPNVPITSISGTVVSGTVFMLECDGTDYFDSTGRHTLSPRRTADIKLHTDHKKAGEASIQSYMGAYLDDGISTYNYMTINEADEDFGFSEGQDFTISCWVKFNFSTNYSSASVFILGDASGDINADCITLRRRANNWTGGVHYYDYEYYLTLPTTSGTFIMKNQLVASSYRNQTVSSYFQHVALVRRAGTIIFYFNGVDTYSIFSNAEIATPESVGCTLATLAFEANEVYSLNTSYYGYINNLEVLKGVARWDGGFSLTPPIKSEPNTFFPGQIDEVMLYSHVKTGTYIDVFNKSVKDELITYT